MPVGGGEQGRTQCPGRAPVFAVAVGQSRGGRDEFTVISE